MVNNETTEENWVKLRTAVPVVRTESMGVTPLGIG